MQFCFSARRLQFASLRSSVNIFCSERKRSNMAIRRATIQIACVIFLQLHFGGQAAAENETDLYIAFITSFGQQYNSSGVVPALELALEEINSRPDVLPGYRLSVFEGTYGDSQCERTTSLDSFFRMIATGPPKLAVLGCGCSIATEPVAEISRFWNLTHISYASATSSLNDRTRFPNFWRTYSSEVNIARPILAIVRHYGWQQLKIITQDETLFTPTTEQLQSSLRNASIMVDMNGTTVFRTEENVATKRDLFIPEIRVYILNMYSTHARRVMCAAVERSREEFDPAFHYSSYVWITLGWYRDQWWKSNVAQDDQVNCTDAELEMLLERSIAIQQFPVAENTTIPTDVSLTSAEFLDTYNERLNSGEAVFNFETTAYHTYDAVWALAFAMNRSLSPLQENGLSLEGFNYQTTAQNISQEIQSQLSYTDFMGVSGLVSFNENGTRLPTNPRIVKYRDSSVTNNCGESGPSSIERVVVGYIPMNDSELLYRRCEDDNTTWTGGVPADGTPVGVFREVHQALFIIYTILASAGIVFAICCMLFNIIFRKRKVVRLTSPNLNYLIILGAILLYTTAYFFIIPTTVAINQTIYCHVRAWTQFIGYFLCFGTIVAKVWRVYYIFHHPSTKRGARAIRDWHLVIFVLVLVALSTVVLIYMEAFDMYYANPSKDAELQSTRNGDQVLVEYFIQKCDGRNSLIWIIVSYAYILITQIAAVFLAFRTRKVKVKALNDSKYIALIIYITSVIITIMIIGAVTLDNYINADAGMFAGLIMVFATVVLVLVFIPKMVILYRDPKGERIFERSNSVRHPTLTSASLNDHERDRMMELEKHCRDLEGRLGKYEHVEPLRSFSKTRLFTGSVDNVRSHTLSTSISKSPYHSINPTQSLPLTAMSPTYPPPSASSPAHVSSATDRSSSDGENLNTTDPMKSRSDGTKFLDGEDRDRKEPLDVNMTV